MGDEKKKSGRKYTPRILSGIQPTGELTLGNYLGAIRNWVALQEAGPECFYCVVDYHAITVEYDPKELRTRSLEMARDLLACGIDPERSTLFIQSHVREHLELAWILASVAAYGDLTRMTHFKEKGEGQAFVSAGLFTYPILQAADILAYQATGVPVGEDQLQHLELCRGIAHRFNQRFGEMFPETQALLTQATRIMSPADPSQKMSKSLGPKHYIGVFQEEKAIAKKIRSHVTDIGQSQRGDEEISSGVTNLLNILEACESKEAADHFRQLEKDGKLLYKDLKPAVADAVLNMLRPIQERRSQFSDQEVRDILEAGAAKARKQAGAVVEEARDRIGLVAG